MEFVFEIHVHVSNKRTGFFSRIVVCLVKQSRRERSASAQKHLEDSICELFNFQRLFISNSLLRHVKLSHTCAAYTSRFSASRDVPQTIGIWRSFKTANGSRRNVNSPFLCVVSRGETEKLTRYSCLGRDCLPGVKSPGTRSRRRTSQFEWFPREWSIRGFINGAKRKSAFPSLNHLAITWWDSIEMRIYTRRIRNVIKFTFRMYIVNKYT